ncbi:hypothetical protein L288_12345 [Sphingobium quisquiliarum P25]|uniref:Secreted protein n=1 Tax=Sphingobium quisquiliarum P25 TaxID=1329909 RepID=T0GP43_9SPHN|nr:MULTISPECIES: hypothetical protein [Sphingobium]EQB05661.1 hypothetical protein L288_12345 [Sphingobium quisquiliarum P25]
MRADARTILTALLLGGCSLLAACGGDEKGSNKVEMKDLEVVDGTTTDAMTDLDGVQSEVPAPASSAGPAANGAAPPAQAEPAANAAQPETEVVTDQ